MEANLIYDIGCNNGDDTDYYLRKGFRVLALDADLSLCNHVSQRFRREIDDGRLTVIHGLLSDANSETAPFYLHGSCTGQSTASQDFRDRYINVYGLTMTEVMVPVVDLSTLLQQHGVPYYMKVDIEGNDLVALKGLKTFYDSHGDRPAYASIELGWHDLLVALEELTTMARSGYSRFLFVNQGMRLSVKAPHPAREGRYVAFDPMTITTGLFGRELDGDWLNVYAATKRIVRICRRHALFRDDPRYSKNGKFSGTFLSKIHNRFRRHVLSDPVSVIELHAAD